MDAMVKAETARIEAKGKNKGYGEWNEERHVMHCIWPCYLPLRVLVSCCVGVGLSHPRVLLYAVSHMEPTDKTPSWKSRAL